MNLRIAGCKHRHVRKRRQWRLRCDRTKHVVLTAQSVHNGRYGLGIAVQAEPISPKRVDRQQNDVGRRLRFNRTERTSSDQNK
ncbi:MAG: hypothetical protein WBM02_10535 [bacterium]